MEVQDHGHIIEVCGDVQAVGPSIVGSKICGDAPSCGFSDAKNSSKDAKERSASMRKLCIAVVLCIVFMSVEVVGGIKANSLAILTDAAHLLSDVAAFAISLFSLWASGWEATPRQSYGFFRIEILGALVSIQMIWLLAGILVYEAIVRLINGPGEVKGLLMFAVSTFGLVVNIAMALLLGHEHGHAHSHGHSHGHGEHGHVHGGHEHGDEDHRHHHGISVTTHHRHHHHHHGEEKGAGSEGVEQQQQQQQQQHQHHDHKESVATPLLESCVDDGNPSRKVTKTQKKQRNINVQGAYLHVLGDSIQSIGVMIGGAIIWYKPEYKILDLICTLIFSAIVLCTTIQMLRNILEVLMESTPREVDATKLEKGLCEMEEVVAIHELHIWAITVGKILLACHVIIKPEANADMVLDKVIEYIRREYNISHVTIQIERQ